MSFGRFAMFNRTRSGNVSFLSDFASWSFSVAANSTAIEIAIVVAVVSAVVAFLRFMTIQGIKDKQETEKRIRENNRRRR